MRTYVAKDRVAFFDKLHDGFALDVESLGAGDEAVVTILPYVRETEATHVASRITRYERWLRTWFKIFPSSTFVSGLFEFGGGSECVCVRWKREIK
ncbi:MAG: hypothetical protein M1830_007100, partial [Pleopsidium flavum]